MNLTQNWVGYLDRSYQQVKRSLLNRLVANAPDITDHSESNPLIIIISMFSGVAEVLNLYIDSMAREAFLGTCRRLASLLKLTRLIDYHGKASTSATVKLLFTLRDNSGAATTHTAGIVIPRGTLINPINSQIPFYTLEDTLLPAGQSSVYIVAKQYTQVNGTALGVTDGTAGQVLALPLNYSHDTCRVFVNGVEYTRYNSFSRMHAHTKGFIVTMSDNLVPIVVFGDGNAGEVPVAGLAVTANYETTFGVLGNLPPDNITQLNSILTLPAGLSITVTNPDYSNGGDNIESMEQIRNRAPRTVRTLERAVTYQDYKDLAMLVPGVGASEVKYCCGKYVELFIAPNSKGVATQGLLSKVKDYMDCKRMLTTKINYNAAGITRIWIQGIVTGKPGYTTAEVQQQVYDALDDEYGIATVELNKRVSITDILTTVENLTRVDTFEIQKVKIEPFARPINGNIDTLNISWNMLPVSTQAWVYRIVYKSATNDFQVWKAGVFQGNLAIGAPFLDANIGFQIAAGVYTNNDNWEFTVHPSYPEIFPTTNILIKDFSGPIVDVSPKIDNVTPRTIFSNITFKVQGAQSACLPQC